LRASVFTPYAEVYKNVHYIGPDGPGVGRRGADVQSRAVQRDANGREKQFEYDTNNRLTAWRFPDITSVEFTYTPTGQPETVADARGVTRFDYDERNRLLSRTDPDGNPISDTYDSAGKRAERGRSGAQRVARKRVEETMLSARGNRVRKVRTASAAIPMSNSVLTVS
jgi:YD repeat-containing protein